MKLQADITDTRYQIDFKQEDGRIFADIDGRKYEAEVSEPEPNVFLLKNCGKVYEIFISPRSDPGDLFQVSVGNSDLEIRLTDPKRLRGSEAANETLDGSAEIKTAMPGKIVRILAAVGDEIKKGDGVIVVEAMKMQNEIKAQKDGVVTEIRVAEGKTVGAGDVLIVIA